MTAVRRSMHDVRRTRGGGRFGKAGLVAVLVGGLLSLASPAMADACAPTQTVPSVGVVVLKFTEASCSWTVPAGVSEADVLVVGGGGGGGDYTVHPGAGGAGGLIYRTTAMGNTPYPLTAGDVVPIAVGTGGPRGDHLGESGPDGADGLASSFGTGGTVLTADGGGGGSGASGIADGHMGGSGGGAGAAGGGGTATSGQGHDGGAGPGGGGGGAGSGGTSGAGGSGKSVDITGSSLIYATGGDPSGVGLPPGNGNGGKSQQAGTPGPGGRGVVIVRFTPVAVVAPGKPGTPTAVAGDGSATVTVTAGSGGAPVTYLVMASPGGQTCTVTVSVGPSCDVSGLVNGTAYTFTSTATNSGGTSVSSDGSDPVTPVLSAPGKPGVPTVVGGDTTATVTVVAPSGGGTPVTYTVTAAPSGNTCLVPFGQTSCIVTGLIDGVSYTFSSTATNTAGTSATASDASLTVVPQLTPAGIPAIASVVAGNGQAVVTITPAGSGGRPDTYTVTAVGTSPLKSCDIVWPGTSCTVTGLSNGVAYTFQAQAFNTADPSGLSDPSSAATPVAPPAPAVPPAAPTGVVLTGAAASVSASWSPVPGATSYTVSAQPGPATCTTTATSCVLGAVAGTSYTVTVVARSSVGNSVASPASNAVTPADPVVPVTTPESVPLTLTTDKGQIALASPGQQIVVIGTGFAPFSTATVILYSTPITLGSVVTDATGSFSVPVTIPAGLDPGTHTFLASGVDPAGSTRQMALPVTVVPTDTGSTGGGDQTGTVPVPAGGSITLLDAGGLPATMVTVPEGTYALDAVTGIISFVPNTGFTGSATSVRYRITDAIGTIITGTYTAVVTKPVVPVPPATGQPTLKLPAKVVVSTGTHGSAGLPCRISKGFISRCTITVVGVVSGHRVIVGHGATVPARARQARAVIVKVTLTALGRALSARPGGAKLTFTAVVAIRAHSGTITTHAATNVLASSFTLARSVRFSTDSHTVGRADAAYLKGIRAKLRAAKAITCIGHADSRGGSREALTLGRQRAKAACAIVAKGLDATVHIQSKGDKAPTGSNNTAAGRARNRRVDISVTN